MAKPSPAEQSSAYVPILMFVGFWMLLFTLLMQNQPLPVWQQVAGAVGVPALGWLYYLYLDWKFRVPFWRYLGPLVYLVVLIYVLMRLLKAV